LLDWAVEHKVKEIRDDIVHAYWWDYAGVGITRGRFHRRGKSELIRITPEQMDEDCAALEWYADALDSALEHGWLGLHLPRGGGNLTQWNGDAENAVERAGVDNN